MTLQLFVTAALALQEEGHHLPLQDGIKAIIAVYNAWKRGSLRSCVSLNTSHASGVFLLPDVSLSIAKG